MWLSHGLQGPFSGPFGRLVLCGNVSGGVSNTINMLAMDLNAERPASTRAALSLMNRLVPARCCGCGRSKLLVLAELECSLWS